MRSTMKTPLIQKNVFQLSEIRRLISKYVAVTDAISCVQVCKDWSKDFALPIWYEVDFKVHTTFEKLSTDVISKYGHHIRVVKNLSTESQLYAILHPSIKCVQVLQISCIRSVRFRTLCLDFIHKNNNTLTNLAMEMDATISQDDLSSRMVSIYPFIPQSSVSRLTSIRLTYICLSRDSFVSLLRGCPFLTNVDLERDVALLSGSSIDTFQHPKVTTLIAPISQVFRPDPDPKTAPPALGSSLLIHFPNLIYWLVYNRTATLIVPIEHIKAEARKYCPKLTQVNTLVTPSSILYSFLVDTFRNLTSVTFAYKEFSTDVILALLFHKATLSEITTFLDPHEYTTERDELPHGGDHLQNGRVVQLLPFSCPNLEILALEGHEMDMDHVEASEWTCRQLQELRVRIRGLDTKEKVDRALQLWLEERRREKEIYEMVKKKEIYEMLKGKMKKKMKKNLAKVTNVSTISQLSMEDTSIEARVARHLLMFDNLKKVWLGTRTCHAPKTI
ncbi:hypothetical protein BGZ50_002366 [Haplosporangium sp. Z 11]|nr:hypothetical protein BGZ50_002366 [Haplosporangium sp. Z 11]